MRISSLRPRIFASRANRGVSIPGQVVYGLLLAVALMMGGQWTWLTGKLDMNLLTSVGRGAGSGVMMV